eukprot:TRINITY_DN427_c0_g1_i1.p1 TRINITY_DN427_c0_g1~~TRINITY_DN427_c0_g1_i1.p1  ORF type:complete len:158 (+),score=49.60 TRINITY_DN427_c0_g1_i1:160-633(+)
MEEQWVMLNNSQSSQDDADWVDIYSNHSSAPSSPRLSSSSSDLLLQKRLAEMEERARIAEQRVQDLEKQLQRSKNRADRLAVLVDQQQAEMAELEALLFSTTLGNNFYITSQQAKNMEKRASKAMTRCSPAHQRLPKNVAWIKNNHRSHGVGCARKI